MQNRLHDGPSENALNLNHCIKIAQREKKKFSMIDWSVFNVVHVS